MGSFNFKPFLDSAQISLEKQAADKFGAVVDDFTRETLGSFGQKVLPPGEQVPFNRADGSFYATSYAHALAGGTNFRPKLKFLFKVEFIFTQEAITSFPELASASSQEFTFMIRSVDRPKIDFEYEKDVNMYNFRTSILKRISHRELTITFMDDTGNRVLDFFRTLMMLYSPITRRQRLRDNTLSAPEPEPTLTHGSGMAFEEFKTGSKKDIAIRGVVNSNVGNVISAIRVKQIFVDSQEPLGRAVKEVVFDFMNARLVSFDLDDLSHETAEVNLMTMQFDYDWMEIVKTGSLSVPNTPRYDHITVPGVGGAPSDISPYGSAGPLPGGGGGFGSGILDILSNQAGRAGQQFVSGAINRGIESIAGRGRFASLISSQASNIIGGVVGGASRDLANGIGRAAIGQVSSLLGGVGSNISQAFARPAVVIDSTEGGGPSPVLGYTESSLFNPEREGSKNEAWEGNFK